MKARYLAMLVAWPAVAAGSTPNPDEGVARDEFRAFVTEAEERARSTRVDELEVERRRLDRALAARGRAYVRLLRSGLLPLSEGFRAMRGHARRAERLRHALGHDVAARARIEREQRELVRNVEELRRRRQALAHDAEEYQRSKDAILAARDREAAFRRAFEGRAQGDRPVAVYAAQPTSARHPSFGEARGRLPLPVAGRAEVRPVRLPDAIGPGVFIAVDAGALVSAVQPGRVVLTGDYGELGRSVVVDHGEGYSTLSARLGVVTVEVGDTLDAGDSIGTLSPEASGNLYFEVRHGGVALPPGEWFGL
jgi:septal ring factor EnvC (AmiA/AmiB activator)